MDNENLKKRLLLSVIDIINSSLDKENKLNYIHEIVSKEEILDIQRHSDVMYQLYYDKANKNIIEIKKLIWSGKKYQITFAELLTLYCGEKIFPLLESDLFEEQDILLYFCENLLNNNKKALEALTESDINLNALTYKRQELLKKNDKILEEETLCLFSSYKSINFFDPDNEYSAVSCYLHYLKENGAKIKDKVSQNVNLIFAKQPIAIMSKDIESFLEKSVHLKQITVFKALLNCLDKNTLYNRSELFRILKESIEIKISQRSIKEIMPFLKAVNDNYFNLDNIESDSPFYKKNFIHEYENVELIPNYLLYIKDILHKIKMNDLYKLMNYDKIKKLNLVVDVNSADSINNAIHIYNRMKATRKLSHLCIIPGYSCWDICMLGRSTERKNNVYALLFMNKNLSSRIIEKLYEILKENKIFLENISLENCECFANNPRAHFIFMKMLKENSISFDLFSNQEKYLNFLKTNKHKETHNIFKKYETPYKNIFWLIDVWKGLFRKNNDILQEECFVFRISQKKENMYFLEYVLTELIEEGIPLSEIRYKKNLFEKVSSHNIALPESFIFQEYIRSLHVKTLLYKIRIEDFDTENSIYFIAKSIDKETNKEYWSSLFICENLQSIKEFFEDTAEKELFEKLVIIYEKKSLSDIKVKNILNPKLRI